MYTVNGLLFGNGGGYDAGMVMSTGEIVRWYLLSVGSYFDVHTIHFHGDTLISRQGKRLANVPLYPFQTTSVDMLPDNPGTWAVHCHIKEHSFGGMGTRYIVDGEPWEPPSGKIRRYFLQIEELLWNYSPTPPPSYETQEFTTATDQLIGSTYKKAKYVRYTDDTFTQKYPSDEFSDHLGILGPVIRAEVGDSIEIVLSNHIDNSFPFGIHAHGVLFGKDSEGASWLSSGPPPGGMQTYYWYVPERAGPAKNDLSSIIWPYHSHGQHSLDLTGPTVWQAINGGLVGPIIITGKNQSTSSDSLKPIGVDKEIIAFFGVFDENSSPYIEQNIDLFLSDKTHIKSHAFKNSNVMNTINGLMFYNFNVNVSKGQHVRWYLFAGSNGDDVHTAHWHGLIVTDGTESSDVFDILPGTSLTVDSPSIDDVGTWLFHCHLNDHVSHGMIGNVQVTGKEEVPTYSRVVKYYIAANEVYWDYSPSATPSQYHSYTTNSPFTIGHVYKKAVYQEFTDETFTKRKVRSKEEEYLGILGPVIRAEVGDLIKVTFLNNASFPFSIHPHGVFYEKIFEGAGTIDSTAAVKPKERFEYSWYASERSKPGNSSSTVWVYHSHVPSPPGESAGLVGLLVVTAKGKTTSKTNLKPVDVDREIFSIWNVFDENESPYLQQNIALFAPLALKTDPGFIESNKMRSVNGMGFNQLPEIELHTNETVRWYVVGLGEVTDMHAPRWRGGISNASLSSLHVDSVFLSPAMQYQVDSIATEQGTWEWVCEVDEHYQAGMRATYSITDKYIPIPNPDEGTAIIVTWIFVAYSSLIFFLAVVIFSLYFYYRRLKNFNERDFTFGDETQDDQFL